MFRNLILLVIATILVAAPTTADAGCSMLSMEDQALVVEEPSAGDWERAHTAVMDVFQAAKTAGRLFDAVYAGGYKVQEIRGEMDAADAAWDEKMLLASDLMGPLEGSCAGDLLGEMIRKATKYREPERNMVLGVLDGTPLKASQKTLHENREDDYLQFERRFVRIRDAAEVRSGGAPTPEPDVPVDSGSY